MPNNGQPKINSFIIGLYQILFFIQGAETMDWVERMNKAVEYIEDNLAGEIYEKEICRITACSFQMFQGSFTQITGVSLSEYVRRRKLTCAAYELQNTDVKVIDIAVKYGYQSADAFRVAFKRLHGITPAEAKKFNSTLTFYCRISFSLNIKGVDKMNYTTIEKEPFKVTGIRRITPYGGGTWAIVKSDGTNERIKEISGKFFDLGLCFGFGEDGSDDYMCAVEWDKDKEDIDGYDSYTYPAAVWLKFEANGKITEGTLGNVWHRIHNEFLPQSKYKLAELPTIEKYVSWDDAADICFVEIWLPVTQK